MAKIKYFNDLSGSAIELPYVTHITNDVFAAIFPGIKSLRYDSRNMWVGRETPDSPRVPVTRKIEIKRFPSLHSCNAKCLNGKHDGACECRCGGKNHGAGLFTSILAAA